MPLEPVAPLPDVPELAPEEDPDPDELVPEDDPDPDELAPEDDPDADAADEPLDAVALTPLAEPELAAMLEPDSEPWPVAAVVADEEEVPVDPTPGAEKHPGAMTATAASSEPLSTPIRFMPHLAFTRTIRRLSAAPQPI